MEMAVKEPNSQKETTMGMQSVMNISLESK
jgi:hypothetical protein